MANHSERNFDNITIIDTSSVRADISDNVSDGLVLSDTSTINSKIIVGEIETLNLVDNSDVVITDYTKRVDLESIQFSDYTIQYVTYRPKLADGIVLSTSSIGNIKTPQDSIDNVQIKTRAYGSVNYKNVDTIPSEIHITDSVVGIVNRYNSTKFKNAMSNMVGTTEVTVYTCLNKESIVMNIGVCNKTLADVLADIIIYKDGITPVYIARNIPIPAHQTFVINSNEETAIALEENDEIRVVTDTIDSSDVYMAIMEKK